MSRTLTLTLAYDGTDYAGWQRQDNLRTVQGEVEAALAGLFGYPVAVSASGRTDAGVHAAGQVVSLALPHPIAPDALVRALNTRLPDDIRIWHASEVAPGFDARRSARLKTYRYLVWNHPVADPLLRRFAWHVPQPLDLDAMAQAAVAVVGDHDFAAFRAAGSDVSSTRRRLVASRVSRVSPDAALSWGPPAASAAERAPSLVCYEVTGNGFLRHMVRTLAGTLVDIGRGRVPVTRMADLLVTGDRDRAGMTAPPHGLVLARVEY